MNFTNHKVESGSEHEGFERQFNEGYFRTEENRYEDGTPAFLAWEAGYEARTAGAEPMRVPTNRTR